MRCDTLRVRSEKFTRFCAQGVLEQQKEKVERHKAHKIGASLSAPCCSVPGCVLISSPAAFPEEAKWAGIWEAERQRKEAKELAEIDGATSIPSLIIAAPPAHSVSCVSSLLWLAARRKIDVQNKGILIGAFRFACRGCLSVSALTRSVCPVQTKCRSGGRFSRTKSSAPRTIARNS